MIVVIAGVPSVQKTAAARLLAARTGFAYHPLHSPVERAEDAFRAFDGTGRRAALDALRKKLGAGRHFVTEDSCIAEEVMKMAESAKAMLFLVRLRNHDAEVRRGIARVAVPGKPALFVAEHHVRLPARWNRPGVEVDLEIQATGKDPSEAAWWILSAGQFVAAVGDEGIQITLSEAPSEDLVLRDNLVRNAGARLLYECLYCNQTYIRDHMLRLDPVRYLVDGVVCVPWSCQWCWGNDVTGISQDEALAQAEEAESLFSQGTETLRLGDAPTAVRLFLRASEFATGYDGLHGNLAAAYAAAGESGRALAEVARALALNAGSALHHHLRARLLEERGEIAEAVSSWRQALRLARRAQLAPPDFATTDLTPLIEEATRALERHAPGESSSLRDETHAYSDCERNVLRAEEHVGKDEWKAALACLEAAREHFVKKSAGEGGAQLMQRINRLLDDCHRGLARGAAPAHPAHPPSDPASRGAAKPRRAGKARRNAPRPPEG